MKHAVATTTHATAAHAAPVAAEAPAEAHGMLYMLAHNANTWIAVSFLIFFALFAKFVWPKIAKSLDDRSDKIRDQLEQASRLRAEAEALLASYQAKQQEMLKEAETIIAHAQRDAAELQARAAEDLKQALDRRAQQAKEKIARAETEAVAHIRTRIIESATETARGLVASKLQSGAEDHAVTLATQAIEQQIH